ncbi:hypothetical protein [Desulfovermiculus halophilus]|uniref:hypothetical protein n=1 Tax=Desulfovermiculus halophilus TaxID=339722 RepID=UPI000687485B|nr:hypothetical protein [Desulfovermiculus halophilus]
MKHVYLALNWGFGVLFLLAGVLSLIESPLAGLCLIAAAALLLPPVRNFAYSKTNQELPVKARVVSVFVLFMAFGFFAGQAQEQKERELAAQRAEERAEKAAQLRQERIDHFNANREQIIASVEKAIVDEDYQAAISRSNKYLVADDKKLEQLNTQAKGERAAIQKAKKTEKLLSELKTIPVEKYNKNRNLYQRLLKMHPNNELYQEKVAFYNNKIEEEKRKKIAAEKRKKKIKSQFSAWDGSHRNLERVIQKSMNDPDSYDHVETVYWDRGDHLIVRTTFRGKNAFGGVVKNSVKAKVSLDGEVLQILDQY